MHVAAPSPLAGEGSDAWSRKFTWVRRISPRFPCGDRPLIRRFAPPSPARGEGKRRVRRQSNRRALRLWPAQVLVEPRHDLDEIAGPRPIVELGGEDAVPAVAAGARRARQAEDVGRARDA